MSRPHVLVLPFPLQGHINPLMQLPQHLASHGFLITFVNSILQARSETAEAQESSHSRSRSSYPGINMVSLSDGLPLEEQRTWRTLAGSVRLHMAPLLEQLISEINQTSSPITCIVADTFMDWVLEIVKRANIAAAFAFFPSGSAQFSILCHAALLISTGRLTPDGVPKDLKDKIKGLPGLSGMQSRDLPWLLGDDSTENKQLFKLVTTMCENAKKFDVILVNSYYDLEKEAIDAIIQQGTKIVPVGPLVFLNSTSYNVASSVLWQEDKGCLKWLDEKPKHSVLYIAFGSIVELSIEELHELALGIEGSQHTFLWVLRPKVIHEEIYSCFPEGFVDRTNGRSYFTSWAPQALVLSHPSIGAFLTHCGWNSIMEAISMGVPMLTWPYFTDQKANSHQIVQEWKVGMPLLQNDKKTLLRQDVKNTIQAILDENEGKKIRDMMENLQDKAKIAMKENIGSSYKNMQGVFQLSRLS